VEKGILYNEEMVRYLRPTMRVPTDCASGTPRRVPQLWSAYQSLYYDDHEDEAERAREQSQTQSESQTQRD
jgi:hypothetical protein